METHNLIINFGKHRGERWTRLPVSYLKWLMNETEGPMQRLAEAELKRRGTTTPTDLELSGHAIDRASQITNKWKEKGVNSWLIEIANEALIEANGEEDVWHKGFKFVFSYGAYYPILKTIIKA